MKKTIILSGPYGGLNIGDDVIGLVMVSEFEKLGYCVIVACDNPKKAQKLFPNNLVIQRLNLRGLKFETIKYIQKVDAVIIGGGEQFEEPRLPNPIWGHIATNIQLLIFSKLFGKFYGTLAVGFNTKMSVFSKLLIKLFLKKANFIGVRDYGSFEFLNKTLGKEKIYLGADPAFLLDKRDKKINKENIIKKFNLPNQSKVILIIPSNDKFHDMKYINILNSFVKKITNENIYVIYAISDIQKGYDLDIYKNKILLENNYTRWLSPDNTNLKSLLEVISAVNCVVSIRMHPLIFAITQETPFVCISRSSKMDSLMEMLKIKDYFNIENINIDKLYFNVLNLLDKNSSKQVEFLSDKIEKIKQQAKEQFIKIGNKIGL